MSRVVVLIAEETNNRLNRFVKKHENLTKKQLTDLIMRDFLRMPLDDWEDKLLDKLEEELDAEVEKEAKKSK